jgi:uncharacterized iron-regulated membrane protein
MWLKRRPEGGLGIPPPPTDRGAARGVLIVVIVAGIVFPLVGLSLIAAFCLEGAIGLVRRLRAVTA